MSIDPSPFSSIALVQPVPSSDTVIVSILLSSAIRSRTARGTTIAIALVATHNISAGPFLYGFTTVVFTIVITIFVRYNLLI